MPSIRVLIYLLRRDLRLADNPILNHIASARSPAYTHLLPLYVFPPNQLEVSGFIADGSSKSPFPEARSKVAGFWRCGPHRAKFLAESLWDMKDALEGKGSGLVMRVGKVGDVVRGLVDGFRENGSAEVVGIWMTGEEGQEERREENDVKKACSSSGIDFKLWKDEKYFVDDRDLPFDSIKDLPDVFTSFRKSVEPLDSRPRPTLPAPESLPPLPLSSSIAPQKSPFVIPAQLSDLITALHKPLIDKPDHAMPKPADMPPHPTTSGHPFKGGSKLGHKRIRHLITSSAMTNYKRTRNGLLGEDFSTKLSAWLALGCITARQVHEYLSKFENGSDELGKDAKGWGKGVNDGTGWVRFELLWRDYMRLCARKFTTRLFALEGFRGDKDVSGWRSASSSDVSVQEAIRRFLEGTTGTGLIDASQRELALTGYTSNRARQNVASFLSHKSHLYIDWRLGAEWYECMLVDYDVYSNWGNWQYVAGVGNDPRGGGEGRVFNPVKQAKDYDPKGDYIKAWIPELRGLGDSDVQKIWQPFLLSKEERERLGLAGKEWTERPLRRIQFGAKGGNGGNNNERGGKKGGRGNRSRGRGGGRSGGKGRRTGAQEKAAATLIQ